MQHIEKDNSKFKPGNHIVKNRMPYANTNRTTEKKYKIPNRINNNRYPKIKNIIDATKKLIGYLISYCYL